MTDAGHHHRARAIAWARAWCRRYAQRIGGLAAALLLAWCWPTNLSAVSQARSDSWGIGPMRLAPLITPALAAGQPPEHIVLPDFPIREELAVRYTLDPALQAEAERLLRYYQPDYGVIVAMDPDNGRVLAMAGSTRTGEDGPQWAMRADYPAASVSKIITAVAAVEQGHATADSVIPFNGKATSLYKRNVLAHRDNRWTRRYSLAQSFARSVNSVFGRLGAVTVGGDRMLEYARRLGFNGRFHSDFEFSNGTVAMDPADPWQVVEMASGFTTQNTLSPLHAAAIAATVANGGVLVAPMLVDEVIGPHGVPLYWYDQAARTRVMSEETAQQLRTMMSATASEGSARGSFDNFARGHLAHIKVGGKTGSLTGPNPRGKYDWFVGYGALGERKIAFATLCINKEFWYVKSPRLARELLEFHFREESAAPSA